MNLFRNWWFLANRMTEPEKLLEPAIAALGERYRSQWLFMGLPTKSRIYIADFVLLDRKLIIEVDGDSHNDFKQKYKDLENAVAMHGLGWHIYRVGNDEARRQPAETVEAALTHPRTSLEELQASLQQHLQEHPELLLPTAKRPRKPRAVRPTSARTRVGARSKR
jgi:very-short-patch-repair endonuclease